MPAVTLGRTGITVEKNAFGALPIQRAETKEAVYILQKAYDHGITFFDTARGYTDSESKLGLAFQKVRPNIAIATKTHASTVDAFWKDLEQSLQNLKTDYIDIYQFHNPAVVPRPGGENGLYDAALEAKAQGKIRFIGITNHRLPVAQEAVESGLYDSLQFPFSYLSSSKDEALVALCREAHMGFLAMKALSGGLITNASAAYAYLAQFDHVLPLWGVQRERELDDFIGFMAEPPQMTPEISAQIQQDREELAGNFCRGCAYCMPCPAGIEINVAARMSLLLQRSPSQKWLSPEGQEKMERIDHCLECGSCKAKCPYELDPPAMLKANLKHYRDLIAEKPLSV